MTFEGGIAHGISIKVGIMVPACCECNSGGSIADPSFPEAPVFDEVCGRGMAPGAAVRNHARQQEENE
jgi:hypothetical protein